MSMKLMPPLTSLLFRKTGVYRGTPIFLIFDLKHTLWVVVRTALAMWFYRVPTINVLCKCIKTIKFFLMNFSIFTAEKNLCILHGQVFVMI